MDLSFRFSGGMARDQLRKAASIIGCLLIGAMGFIFWTGNSSTKIVAGSHEAEVLHQLVHDLIAQSPWYRRLVSRALIKPVARDPKFLAQVSGVTPIQGHSLGTLVARTRVRWFNSVDQAQIQSWSRQWKASQTLVQMGTNAWPAIPALLDLTHRSDPNDRFYALMVLYHIDAGRWPQFRSAVLRHANSHRSIESFCWFADRRNESWLSINGLVSTVVVIREEYRRFALRCLSALGPSAKEAVPDLLRLAQAKEDHEFAAAIIQVFGTIGSGASAAEPLLKTILQDSGEWSDLRAAAAQALSRINPNGPETRTLLERALRDDHALVRVRAAGGLAQLRGTSEGLMPILTNALGHKLASVRIAALESLAELRSNATPVGGWAALRPDAARDPGWFARTQVQAMPPGIPHSPVYLVVFWVVAFVTLCVALMGLSLFSAFTNGDLELHGVFKELSMAAAAAAIEGVSVWLIAMYVPGGASRGLFLPLVLVGLLYHVAHYDRWNRYDAIILLIFQGAIVVVGAALWLRHFQLAFVVLAALGIFVAIFANLIKSL